MIRAAGENDEIWKRSNWASQGMKVGAIDRYSLDLAKGNDIAGSGFQPQLSDLSARGGGRMRMVQRKLVRRSPQDDRDHKSQKTDWYGTKPPSETIQTQQAAAIVACGRSRVRE